MSKTAPNHDQDRDLREQIEGLGREVYGDDFEKFLATPRRSLDWDTPASLMLRGDHARVLALLGKIADGHFT